MKTKLNVKLLRKIQEHILAEPKRFIMGDVIIRCQPGEEISDYGIDFPAPSCGTVACICGWACILGGQPRPLDEFHAAKKLLGLEDTSNLFYVSGWPAKYMNQWDAAETPRMRARIAVRRIDHFIKTKGAE